MKTTIAALSTATGQGAIAVIRLSGPDAVLITQKIFRGKVLEQQASHTLHYGTILKHAEVLDEVVVSLYRAPHSYTREDVVEISCHNSLYIINSLLELLIENGAIPATAGEFTMRAFVNGAMDLSRAEAVADLIASNNRAAHQVAINQMRGGFTTKLDELRQQMLNFLSLLELELDFGEEDVEFADRTQLLTLVGTLENEVKLLIQSFKVGNAIKNGVPVAIVGKPNAGKSTLLNALLNEERAIVSPIPGTTRDTIEEVVDIGGIAFRFIDTAGLRSTDNQIEAIGVERAMLQIEKASVALYLFDALEQIEDAHTQYLTLKQLNPVCVAVANKTEKITHGQLKQISAFFNNDVIMISARERLGLEALKQALLKAAGVNNLSNYAQIVTNVRHLHALTQAKLSLEAAHNNISSGSSTDLLAADVRTAMYHIGEITGAVSTDDLLGNIFSKFCIGK